MEGERLLAVQEAQLVALKKQNKDLKEASGILEAMRQAQQARQEDRRRLLQLIQR